MPLLEGLETVISNGSRTGSREHTFPPGAHVTVEGQRGARVLAFFIIEEGTATVAIDDEVKATLGPGDHFGEIALFNDSPRGATVTADTGLRCLALPSWEFRPFVEEHPAVGGGCSR